jgi:dTDP-4-dehydrorhamnose reductase
MLHFRAGSDCWGIDDWTKYTGMVMTRRIYMAGCGGMLGEAFQKTFVADSILKCTDIDRNEPWLSYLDFRDLDAYRKDVSEFKPDYLFHLGAHTDLEFCELHPDDSYLTNTIAAENAAFIANELGIPLLYISTAGIFDGKQDVYDDWDEPNPLGHYARSKYAGEVFVQANVARHLICRAGWMMGGGPKKDKKFVQKVMKQLKDGKKTLHVVNDKLGTPTYTHDFAQNVELLLRSKCWGLFNMVCEGVTSRLEVAREIVGLLELNSSVEIAEVSSDYFKKEYFAERPPSERLINRRLNLRKLNTMRHWKIGLREYLDAYYAKYLESN